MLWPHPWEPADRDLLLCLPQDASRAFCVLRPAPHQPPEATHLSSDVCECRPHLPRDLEVGDAAPGESLGAFSASVSDKLLSTAHPRVQGPKDCPLVWGWLSIVSVSAVTDEKEFAHLSHLCDTGSVFTLGPPVHRVLFYCGDTMAAQPFSFQWLGSPSLTATVVWEGWIVSPAAAACLGH